MFSAIEWVKFISTKTCHETLFALFKGKQENDISSDIYNFQCLSFWDDNKALNGCVLCIVFVFASSLCVKQLWWSIVKSGLFWSAAFKSHMTKTSENKTINTKRLCSSCFPLVSVLVFRVVVMYLSAYFFPQQVFWKLIAFGACQNLGKHFQKFSSVSQMENYHVQVQ